MEGILMNKIFNLTSIACFLFFSLIAFAADIPGLDDGTDKLNMEECVGENYQQCLDDVCLTSDEIDCNSNCQSLAEDKCEQQAVD
ncbi:TPA: hypothetical protein F7048_04635 [Legionella pneumophila]|nr:hypothetical protein [Legionella pneumophila]HAT7902050.1 hypothetical protein [Legionella pneumophila]HAT8337029.1 hypothetical protein [Legionella pneumophila]HAT8343011.1 hypothetical protein [Legionella pneumophila]HAU0149438.1 hypothetical protein [Legionella pneumophila]